MLTIIFVGIMVVLLVAVGIFAVMARSNKRRGQSGEPGGSDRGNPQGRAPGID